MQHGIILITLVQAGGDWQAAASSANGTPDISG
jgi:hypothetical protein